MNPYQYYQGQDPYQHSPYAGYTPMPASFYPNPQAQSTMQGPYSLTPVYTPSSIPNLNSSLAVGPQTYPQDMTYPERGLQFQQSTRFGPSNDPNYWRAVALQSQQRLDALSSQMQAMIQEAQDKKKKQVQPMAKAAAKVSSRPAANEQASSSALLHTEAIAVDPTVQIHENMVLYLSSLVETFRDQNTKHQENYDDCRKYGMPANEFIDGYRRFLKGIGTEQHAATSAWIANELFNFLKKFESTKLVPLDIKGNNPHFEIIGHGRILHKKKYKRYVMDIVVLEDILKRFYPHAFENRSLVPDFKSWDCYLGVIEKDKAPKKSAKLKSENMSWD